MINIVCRPHVTPPFLHTVPSAVLRFFCSSSSEEAVFILPLLFLKPVSANGGARPGSRRRCSVGLCGCRVQDSFVGPGMHSLAVKSAAWLWLIVLCWVSIRPVCNIQKREGRGEKRRGKEPPLFGVPKTNKELWLAVRPVHLKRGWYWRHVQPGWVRRLFHMGVSLKKAHHDEHIMHAGVHAQSGPRRIEVSLTQD